jgi:hypothetical protein
LAKVDLKALARHGAVARIEELSAEINAIYRMFPDLRGGRRGTRKASAAPAEPVTPGRRSGRKPMTAAQRKAVGARMKKYWAERRKKKGQS